MVYTDVVEYNIIGDTRAPLLRCFPYMKKLGPGHQISSPTYVHYQSFERPQYRKLLKNNFHSIQVELRDAIGQLIPFIAVGITRLTLEFRKII